MGLDAANNAAETAHNSGLLESGRYLKGLEALSISASSDLVCLVNFPPLTFLGNGNELVSAGLAHTAGMQG